MGTLNSIANDLAVTKDENYIIYPLLSGILSTKELVILDIHDKNNPLIISSLTIQGSKGLPIGGVTLSIDEE